jgi:hypothetical protein
MGQPLLDLGADQQACVRLAGSKPATWASRIHLFAIAARLIASPRGPGPAREGAEALAVRPTIGELGSLG